MAQRIRARAIRRAGELLAQIEPSKGGRPPETKGGTSPSFSRKAAATEAGMSPDQAKQALRVAAVPAPDFEALVEAVKPAAVTQIAGNSARSSAPN